MDLVGGESTLVSVECGYADSESTRLTAFFVTRNTHEENTLTILPIIRREKTRRCVRSEFSTTLRDLNVTQVLEKTLWAVRNDTFACIEDTWYRVLPFRPVSTPLHCLQNSIP